jgi:putative membrane protein
MLTKLLTAGLFAFAVSFSAHAAEKLNDAQIAHIAYTAGQIDITAADQALTKSKYPTVVDFAKEMARDHKAVNDEALKLVKKLGVTPEDNPVSQSLEKNAKAEHAKLAKLDGAAFDKAYIGNEVAFHEAVINEIKDTLIPDAQNPELKNFLGQGATLFTEHLKHAKTIADEIK